MKLRPCIYCGRPSKWRRACSDHRDLLALDPHFMVAGDFPDPLAEAVADAREHRVGDE